MILIDRRFRGPVNSGNGGYSAGSVAAALGQPLGPAEITLHSPPPLDVELRSEVSPAGVRVHSGSDGTEVLIASGRTSELALTAPAAVALDEATDAAARCPWLVDHPYPECFVCGIDRAVGDGLRIFPGPVSGWQVAAAPWTPDASVCNAGLARPEVVWASVDCPSLFGYGCFHEWDALMLLGRFTGVISRLPKLGEPCVTMGWFLERDGRKHQTAAALRTAEGELLAVSRATWITLR